MPDRNVKLLFALFALSGFTGLIYESVWSHYLKLFLGAAAFAQSFVLAAFMGGMALGAWLASRWSTRLKNLLAAYGWIEAAIGVAALIFHESFLLLTQFSLDQVLPTLGSPAAVEIYKYSLCAVLIVPQTVLLGMTFPLLSGAVIRRGPEASGHHLATLYFTNSIGAAAGALASAFLLLGWIGMPGTMRLAGALNLALAVAVLAIARSGEPAPLVAQPRDGAKPLGTYLARLFLAGAFVTGLSSFVYEIAWIRMLSLVLGSSFQAFELMLSAFITGLALGSLWIRRRIDKIADPVRYAGLVQLGMGLAALATIFVYHWTFDWMAWALAILQHNEAAYPIFNLFSHALAFAVMLPATFLAGMTLPLFTHVLLRGGRGERAIGQVYASNTLGAIAGVLLAVHLLMPEAGLKLALVLGAAADMLLGAWLLRYSLASFRRLDAFAAVILGMLAATATARADILEPERLSSGVFRYGRTNPDFGRVYFYREGKTASVAVRGHPVTHVMTIITNGKPDASVRLDPDFPPTSDEYTQTLVAALPLLIKPDAKTFASIGWGSGLTAEVLLSHGGPRVRQQDFRGESGTPADAGESLRIGLDEQRQGRDQSLGVFVRGGREIRVETNAGVRLAVGDDRHDVGDRVAAYRNRSGLALAVEVHAAEVGVCPAVAEYAGGEAFGFKDVGASCRRRGEHAQDDRSESVEPSERREGISQQPRAEQHIRGGSENQRELEPGFRHEKVHGEEHSGDGAEGVRGVHLADRAFASPAAQQHVREKRQRHSGE